MLVSTKSLSIFISLNTFLICLALLQAFLIEQFIYNNVINIFNIFLIFIARNYTLLYFVNTLSNDKPLISNDMQIVPKEDYNYEFDMNVISSTTIETLTHVIIKGYYSFDASNMIYFDLACFIPISFMFELIFDLFHYIGHRTLHSAYLYKYIHKKHHKFQHPTTIITFYQDPIDIITTNSLPVILTLSIIPRLSYFQFSLIIIYKTYGEICGHLGKKCYPTGSFCQFIWIPKLLNIELYTEEHDLHHSLNNCNYSKRFSLWDKAFGTFKSCQQLS